MAFVKVDIYHLLFSALEPHVRIMALISKLSNLNYADKLVTLNEEARKLQVFLDRQNGQL